MEKALQLGSSLTIENELEYWNSDYSAFIDHQFSTVDVKFW